jgi:hypothetical protein
MTRPSNISFYFTESEMAPTGQPLAQQNIWNWHGSAWNLVPRLLDSVTCDSGDINCFVQGTVTQYSPFTAGPAAPNAIDLAGFTATALENGSVLVEWETAAEWDHAGFNVYRNSSEAPLGVAVNEALIAAQGLQGQGAAYELLDNSGLQAGLWYYTLEDVDIYGVATLHGPIAVTVVTPLAVTLQQSGTGTAAAPLVTLLLLAVLAGATVILRRRPSA